MKRSQGYKSKGRNIFRKSPRERGMRSLGYLLTDYSLGDKVLISIDPSFHKGQPYKRYHGKSGIISERRGEAYVINVQDGGKMRQIIARAEHLKRQQI
jgi:large subunit ribosomal protein L21e